MAGNGGKRPGAGRKSNADKYGGHIDAAKDRIVQVMPSLIDNMLVLANGVKVQDIDDDGNVVTYTKPPDRQANEYLINRIMGKPTEVQEISGPDGGPIELTAGDRTEATRELEAWREKMKRQLALPAPN